MGLLENDQKHLTAAEGYVELRIFKEAYHKLEKIVDLQGIRLTISEAGTWSGLAADDSPLILRDVGSQEIYALDLQLP